MKTKITIEETGDIRTMMLAEEGFEDITELAWTKTKKEERYNLHSALFSALPQLNIYANETTLLILDDYHNDKYLTDKNIEELEKMLGKKYISNVAYVMNQLGRDWIYLTK